MIRPVLTELALFLAPFVVYALFLWATRAGVLHPDSWSLPRIACASAWCHMSGRPRSCSR